MDGTSPTLPAAQFDLRAPVVSTQQAQDCWAEQSSEPRTSHSFKEARVAELAASKQLCSVSGLVGTEMLVRGQNCLELSLERFQLGHICGTELVNRGGGHGSNEALGFRIIHFAATDGPEIRVQMTSPTTVPASRSEQIARPPAMSDASDASRSDGLAIRV